MFTDCTCDNRGTCDLCVVKTHVRIWGREHHWPTLPVGPSWSIAAEETYWNIYLATHSLDDLRLAEQSITHGGLPITVS